MLLSKCYIFLVILALEKKCMKRFLSLKRNEREGKRSTQVSISPSQTLVKYSSLCLMREMISCLPSLLKILILVISLEIM